MDSVERQDAHGNSYTCTSIFPNAIVVHQYDWYDRHAGLISEGSSHPVTVSARRNMKVNAASARLLHAWSSRGPLPVVVSISVHTYQLCDLIHALPMVLTLWPLFLQPLDNRVKSLGGTTLPGWERMK